MEYPMLHKEKIGDGRPTYCEDWEAAMVAEFSETLEEYAVLTESRQISVGSR